MTLVDSAAILFERINQREPGFRIVFTAQMLGRFGENDFQRWPDVCLKDMAAVRTAVGFSDHHVSVDLRSSIGERDVADKRERFPLLAKGYFFVIFFVPIEVAQRYFAKCADRSKVTSAQLVFLGPGREPCDELFVLHENERVGALSPGFEHSNVHKVRRFLCVAHNSSAIVIAPPRAQAVFRLPCARSRSLSLLKIFSGYGLTPSE